MDWNIDIDYCNYNCLFFFLITIKQVSLTKWQIDFELTLKFILQSQNLSFKNHATFRKLEKTDSFKATDKTADWSH